MDRKDPLSYHDRIHGEIRKARLERDDAVAQLILDAAQGLALYVARIGRNGVSLLRENE